MKVYKVIFMRKMRCSTKVIASNYAKAREVFIKGELNPDFVDIVKDSQVVDEIITVDEIPLQSFRN